MWRRPGAKSTAAARRTAQSLWHWVGYTNAGKSTLMNQLTQAGVLAEDKLLPRWTQAQPGR